MHVTLVFEPLQDHAPQLASHEAPGVPASVPHPPHAERMVARAPSAFRAGRPAQMFA